MYMVTKAQGYRADVVVTNPDTSASVIVGQPTMAIQNILKDDAGFTDSMFTVEPLSIEVTKEVADKLIALTFRAKKPVRKSTPKVEATEDKKPVDIDKVETSADTDFFKLLYGLN